MDFDSNIMTARVCVISVQRCSGKVHFPEFSLITVRNRNFGKVMFS